MPSSVELELNIGGVLSVTSAFDRIVFSGTSDGTSSYLLATAAGGINGAFDAGSAPAGYQFSYEANELNLVPVRAGHWATGVLLGYTHFRKRWCSGAI